jgi:DNA-binding transcriptional MerR regulator
MAGTEDTISRSEAAKRYGRHYNTIRKWEKKGLVTPQRIMVNGVEEVRLPVAELDAVAARMGGTSDDVDAARPTTEESWEQYEELQRFRRDNAALEATVELLREQVEFLRGHLSELQEALTVRVSAASREAR